MKRLLAAILFLALIACSEESVTPSDNDAVDGAVTDDMGTIDGAPSGDSSIDGLDDEIAEGDGGGNDSIQTDAVFDGDAPPSCTTDDDCQGILEPPGPCERPACIDNVCTLTSLLDGALCTPDDLCVESALCNGGVCDPAGGITWECDDLNSCTTDACDPATGACVHTFSDDYCDDGNQCTKLDRCTEGLCLGQPSNDCVCDTEADCDALEDGDMCHGTMSCVEGTCTVDPATIVTCSQAKAGPCTVNACVPETGMCTIQDVPDGHQCSDGNPCTVGDTCVQGECTSGLHKCSCETDSDCIPYDDGDACTGVLACQSGACEVDPATVVACEGSLSTQCMQNTCDPLSGTCALVPLKEGAPCNDGSLCTSFDACLDGACTGGTQIDCTDDNPCTLDACDPLVGCTDEDIVGLCDDGNACTLGDVCVEGMCIQGSPLNCDDGNPCTDESCDYITGCSTETNTDPCNDGNPCTVGDICLDGACTSGSDYQCGTCTGEADCAIYNDADLCNGTMACVEGSCIVPSDSIIACDSSLDSTCQTSTCQGATGECLIVASPDGSSCDDGDPCTAFDACEIGICMGGKDACDDGNPCTDDVCAPETGACTSSPNSVPCDDGDGCTGGDVCSQGTCLPGEELLCGTCPGMTNIECVDDGDACNGVPICNDDGHCVLDKLSIVTCDTGGDTACTKTTCDPDTGACGSGALPAGTSCNDGDYCTSGDQCMGGQCQGEALSCDDGNVCTNDSCNPASGCIHVPNLEGCDDSNACTTDDKCIDGACAAGLPMSCDDDDVCTTEVCDPGEGCVYEDTWITECDDGFGCTDDFCDPITGCYYTYTCPEFCGNGIDDDGDGETDCDDIDCEESPTCTGEGSCEPIAIGYCNTTIEADLTTEPLVELMSSYSCGSGNYDGPEQVYELQTFCPGTTKVTTVIINTGTDQSVFIDVMVIQESVAGDCLATQCIQKGVMNYNSGYGKGEVLFNAQKDVTYHFAVDGRDDATAPYSLQILCDCL